MAISTSGGAILQKLNLNLIQVESGRDRCALGHLNGGQYREGKPGGEDEQLKICGAHFFEEHPQELSQEALLGGGPHLALRADCEPGYNFVQMISLRMNDLLIGGKEGQNSEPHQQR